MSFFVIEEKLIYFLQIIHYKKIVELLPSFLLNEMKSSHVAFGLKIIKIIPRIFLDVVIFSRATKYCSICVFYKETF
jgi:hypothetical protein